ncbi:MAG: glutamyl-tRNA reductase [Planctomycetes bacterium]|nr:glutamyl-tRNA reductase [Planctomycetota bacterium]
MHRIAIAGLSVHETDVAGLEQAKARLVGSKGVDREIADRLGASELVVISTCNRLEISFAREAGHLPSRADVDELASTLAIEPELAQRFHFFTGRDAVRHLFRVAASLDSLVLGEDQILAQVRDAHKRAEDELMVGKLLGTLFQAAEHAGKEVRSKTELARRPISVSTLAVEHVVRRFRGKQPALALWGAGEMARLAALCAREMGFQIGWVASRTRERGEPLAKEFGAQWIDARSPAADELALDALISATTSPGFVRSTAQLSAYAARSPLGTGLLAVDLALPRDLEPTSDPKVELVDLEKLRETAERNRLARVAAARDAERLVERQVEVYAERDVGKRAAEALAELSGATHDIFERELGGLFTGPLADLDDERRRAIERWARQTFGRIEHAPIATIKRLVHEIAARGAETK